LLAALLVAGVAAAWIFWRRGDTLAYGDAEAHLNIARRIVDSRTPGYEQIGTVWLPLLHWLLIPFARVDSWWRSGLAGVPVSVASYVAAGFFLYRAASSSLGPAAGVAAALLFALNPNLLFLQSTPMTEPLFFAALCGLAAAIVWFSQSGSWSALVLAGLAALAATLIRYDGWWLLPFAALAILLGAPRDRWAATIFFCLIAAAGPLYWLIHNRWFYSNWLEFYNGPYSAKAIQGAASYAGQGDWITAARYFFTAARECLGWPMVVVAAVGLPVAILRRAWIPLLLFASGPLFYIASLHSGGTPIQVPDLWPGGYYNTRYGMAALPLAAFAAGSLATLIPRWWMTAAVVAVALSPWVFYPRVSNWIVYQESQVNSRDRRTWTRESADFLRREYRAGDGVFLSFGDQTGICRTAGISLRETMHEGNGITFLAGLTRPDLFWWQRWAIAREGDAISRALRRYKAAKLVQTIRVNQAPAIEIYENARPLRQGARRPK
jgi:hypothetical protein